MMWRVSQHTCDRLLPRPTSIDSWRATVVETEMHASRHKKLSVSV
jgi:hypothetical protein